MPNYRIQNLELVASYNSIGPSFATRPSPQQIAHALFQRISPSLDIQAALDDLVQNDPYSAADAKAAATKAQGDVLAKLNEVAQGVQVDFVSAVFYRRTTSGTHETIVYLMKSEHGGPMQPWAFSLNLGTQPIEGYAALSFTLAVDTSDQKAGGNRGQTRSKEKGQVLGNGHSRHGGRLTGALARR